MKINIGKLLGKAVSAVKRNPEIALIVVGAVAPKLASKAAKVVIAAKAVEDA